MECKSDNKTNYRCHPAVLIETLWNVNNIEKDVSQVELFSINRNIMECKYTAFSFCRRVVSVLIETLWNVNPFAWKKGEDCDDVLIETLWNVNSIASSAVSIATTY